MLSCLVSAGEHGGGSQLMWGGLCDMRHVRKACGHNGLIVFKVGRCADLQQVASAELEFTLCFVGAAAPLAADAALCVAWPPGAVSVQELLGGPFSDVAIVCGGRRFDASRAVLATASPVFHRMLASGMAEGGGAPEVEIKEADPAALELLLQHAYGAAVDVPLALAPQLYGLADRFQMRTDLAEQLLLWLSTVDVQPAVLCELVPAAHTLCPAACRANLYRRT